MFNLQVSPHNSLRIPEKLKGVTRQMAIQTIASYQHYLSPLKGYHCAHRQLHGGLSCSEYVKQTIASQGLRRSLPLSYDRFQACRAALETLKQRRITLDTDDPQALDTAPPQATDPPVPDPDDPPAETITQGEYYSPDPEFNPPPPPNPLGSCCVCGAVDVCCGGPISAGGMGCGDPLEACSCCWGGCNFQAISCCF